MVYTLEEFKRATCEEKVKDIELEFVRLEGLYGLESHEHHKHEQVDVERRFKIIEAYKRIAEKVKIWAEECK